MAGEEQLPAAVRAATRALDDAGVNLNQAVRRFHSTGQPPPDLAAAALAVSQATAAVESTMARAAPPARLAGAARVIGKVLRGGQVGGLVRYLYGPGRANEHVEPRIVAGWRPPERLEPPTSDAGVRDFRRLVGLLREPAEASGLGPADRPVYHLVAAAAKADPVRGVGAGRPLSDGEWAEIAVDLMDRTGLTRRGSVEGVRWIAVRHDQPGAEHVHIVATLATESGRRVSPRNDFYRVGEGCRAAEDRYGLRGCWSGSGTATPTS